MGPEGGHAIPKRNLYVVASEVDDRGDNVRSTISIYRYGFKMPSYPTIVSLPRADGTPIAWSALSGLAAEIRQTAVVASGKGKKKGAAGKSSNILYAVEDSFYKKSRIFTIDTSAFPAKITSELRLMDSMDVLKNTLPFGANLVNVDKTVNLDMEGIAVSKKGGFWVCSEGAGTVGDAARPVTSNNYLIKIGGTTTTSTGMIEKVVLLPADVNAKQVRFGFEGCAEGSGLFADTVVVVFQREWTGETQARIGAYNQVTGVWTFYFYPLDAVESQNGGWVGLSDISPLGVGGEFLVIERDNMAGPDAVIKRIYKIDLGMHSPGDTVTKTLVRDVYPDLKERSGIVVEKVEGLTVDGAGGVWLVNDNDGLSNNNGETQLFNVMSTSYRPKF